MIELNEVTKRYFHDKQEYTVLDNISLKIQTGEYIAITGRSGSGKSTLLNLIGALDIATGGTIIVDEINLTQASKQQLAQYRNQHIGFIFQRFNLEPEYNVIQNVELPALISGKKTYTTDIRKLLEKLNIADKAKIKAKYLSGGEQQRVAIARALINNPSIILADEPCGNLDVANSMQVMDILDTLHDIGKTVILVTHDASDASRAYRKITLSNGHIVQDESNM